MAEVEEDDGDGFSMSCKEVDKRLHLGFRYSVFEKLFRVLGESVQTVAKTNSRRRQRERISTFGLLGWELRRAASSTFVSRTVRSCAAIQSLLVIS